jgi:hypothetical protein
MKKFNIIFLCALLFCLTVPASGHVPYFKKKNSKFFQLKMPLEKSVVVYSSFSKTGAVDLFQFELKARDFNESATICGLDVRTKIKGRHPLINTDEKGIKGRRLFVSTVIPGCETYKELLPQIALVGPKGDYFQDLLPEEVALLPFNYDPSTEGVVLIKNDTQGPLWYEKYTRKHYFMNKETSVTLSRPGQYKIYTWEPNGKIGDYALAVGDIEVWRFKEIMRGIIHIVGLWRHKEIHSKQCKKELKALKKVMKDEKNEIVKHD